MKQIHWLLDLSRSGAMNTNSDIEVHMAWIERRQPCDTHDREIRKFDSCNWAALEASSRRVATYSFVAGHFPSVASNDYKGGVCFDLPVFIAHSRKLVARVLERLTACGLHPRTEAPRRIDAGVL